MSENFASLINENLESVEMRPGKVITGVVIDVDNDWVTVYAGLKSESIISRNEFLNEKGDFEVTVGDEVQIMLEQVEDGFGMTRMSREKAKLEEAWTLLNQSHEESFNVSGTINDRIKGGFSVDVHGIRCFLPGSLVDIRSSGDNSYLIGNTCDFKVIKLNRERNNVVVSRRAALEVLSSEEINTLLDSLEEGSVIKGYIKNLTAYGAFIDLGGIDGLLHITDISWKRIKHPADVLTVGDELSVMVLSFDRDNNRVSLGLKQMSEDPWKQIVAKYAVNSKVQAKVTNITDFGCFAEVDEGIEGLIHTSEMDWTNKNVNPNKVVKPGEEIEVMVLQINSERKRLSLSIKQCIPNPWDLFAKKFEKGSITRGCIKSITDFGLFIGLEGDIDGLVHISDLPQSNESDSERLRNYSKEDEIDVMVLSVDTERERISLGVRQLEQTKLLSYLEAHNKGTIVTGTVINVVAERATIMLSEEVEASLKAVDISREKVEDARTVLNVGDEIEVKIIYVDMKKNRIGVSIKAREADLEKEAIIEHRKQSTEQATTTSIGDLIKAQIDSNNN